MPDKKPAKPVETKTQIEKFQELAREIGADDFEQPLNEAIRKVGGASATRSERQAPPSVAVLQFDGTWVFAPLTSED